MTRALASLRSLWSGVRRRPEIESDMHEEFRLHMELRTRDLIHAGLAPDEARRRARVEFGSVEQFKDEGRESRGLRNVDRIRFSWLDFKLGFRMLVRYPGLTLVGGFAIAFAIWVGAGTFEFLNQVVYPKLPLAGGDRLVALRNRDARLGGREMRAAWDFAIWRRELRSVEDLGAWREFDRNLIVGEGLGEPVRVAEISASAFRLARVPALLGRTLLAADERSGAQPVVVVGYDVWRSRFAGDSSVVGRTVRLGATPTVIVGIMPKGFAFPVAHDIWTPLRLDPAGYERRQGPGISIFGRLASGVSLAEAQSELSRLGQRAAADHPDTHEHLRPRVLPFAKSFRNVQGWASFGVLSSNLLLVMLLALICANVGLLMFARAATRESELVVRTALGASRGRIVTQLFAEALVLGAIACVLGLAAARYGLEWAYRTVILELLDGDRLPFWFHQSLGPATIAYAFLLALIAAVVTGVLPAMKITRAIGTRLKQTTAGGGGLKFSGVWTAVIVTQVAVTTAFPAVAFSVQREAAGIEHYDLGFAADRFLTARLEMDRESVVSPNDSSRGAFQARYAARVEALDRRLRSHSGIAGVTYVDRLPRTYHGWNRIEVDEGAVEPPDARGHVVSAAGIDIDYFDALGTPLLSGRRFHSGDLAPDARVVIVNQPFVDHVLGGRNPIGRRVRYVSGESEYVPNRDGEESPWFEIIGVARDLGTTNGFGRKGIYHPIGRGAKYGMHIALQVRGVARSFIPELRALAIAVDPALRLHDVMPLDEVVNTQLKFYSFWVRLTFAVSAIALVLSLTGVYAVMSFAVSRRTREIGVRVALGAEPRSILVAIFRRPLTQVAAGVLAGGLLTGLLTTGSRITVQKVGFVAAYAVLVMAVCMLACIVPTRRALRVQPTEALREDG